MILKYLVYLAKIELPLRATAIAFKYFFKKLKNHRELTYWITRVGSI